MRAIDVHVHPTDERISRAWAGESDDAERFFRGPWTHEDLDATAARYAALDTLAVLLGADAETTTGVPAYPERRACRGVSQLSGSYSSASPASIPGRASWRFMSSNARVRELGLKGAKFHPGRQEFYPNDRRFYPLFETASALGGDGPVSHRHDGGRRGHAGRSRGRAWTTRGRSTSTISPPTFRRLTIIAAHPSWPWADEGLALARHKSNVFLDLSGYSPKYIPPQYIQFANTLLQDQMLFGSDYPVHPTRALVG